MKYPSLPISSFCSTGSGGTPSRANVGDYYGGTIPWVKSGELREAVIFDTEEKITELALKESSAKLVPKGALLIAMYGATIGRIAELGVEGTTNQAICHIVPDEKIADKRYLYYGLRFRVPELIALGAGGAQPNINQQIIRDTQIPLPPLPEQKRIAAILDKADSIRRKRQEAVRLTEDLLRSVFLEMFGDPVTNSKGWNKSKLSEVVMGKYGIKAGPFGSSLKKEDYTTSGYRIYGQEQVIAGRFDIGDYYIGDRKYQQLKGCEVAEGDLLVSLVGSFGKVLVVPSGIEPGIINPRLLKITPNRDLVTPTFLAAVIGNPSIQTAFEQMAHGGTMGILNVGLLKQLDVILPPVKVQQEFASRLEVLKKLELSLQSSANGSVTLFNSLLQRAFTGAL